MACLLFNELECLAHHGECVLPLLSDGHHGKDSGLEAVLQHERRASPRFEVEGDRLQAAHVEECFILDFRDTRVVQVFAVHERPLLGEVSLVLDIPASVPVRGCLLRGAINGPTLALVAHAHLVACEIIIFFAVTAL